ncbi:MAG TPA: enoyl-CoA hydratase/isomerase family protein [Myxococcota bacterium]|jgi:enoyl-CoA hydratase
MDTQDIRIERRGEVEILTLDRPEQRNALTFRTYAELEHAVRSTTARCLVITGSGTAFCSGDDVRQVMGGGERKAGDRLAAAAPRLTPAAEALLMSNVPVVAAVNGAAVGWGMELAMMCDLRVASERAKFGELFVLRGLCCDVAGLSRLASLVGREKAAELLYTGDVIDAQEALRIGLVSRVVPDAQLMESAVALATKIASNPPLAVSRLKAGLREALDPDWKKLGEWVSRSLGELFKTEDHREGVKSFLEKRAAKYVGR